MPATDGTSTATGATDPLAYDLKEAARLLSVSYRKIRYMADAGELPVFKVGRVRRVSHADLEEFIREQRRQRDEERQAS